MNELHSAAMHSKKSMLDPACFTVSADGLDDFFWAVSPFETRRVRDTVADDLAALLRCRLEADPRDNARAVLVLFFHIIIDVLSIFQNYAAIRRARECNRAPVVPKVGRTLPALVCGEAPAFPPVIKELKIGPYRPKLYRLPLRIVRAAFLRETVIRYPVPRADWQKDIVAIALGDLIEGHARVTTERVVYRGPHTWFRPIDRDGPSIDIELLEQVVSAIAKAFRVGNEQLPNYLVDYFRNWLAEAASLVEMHMQRLDGQERILPRHLWTGSGAQIWSRMLRCAVRDRGGMVCGHDHGAGAGHIVDRHKALRDLEHCTRFATFSVGQKIAIQENADPELLMQRALPEFINVPISDASPEMKAWRNRRPRSLQQAAEKRITVMYASVFPDLELVHFKPAYPAVVLFDWMPRLMVELSRRYYLLWKPYPGWSAPQVEKFASDIGTTRVDGPFEDAIQRCDVLVMDWTQTSAIPIAVCSDRPLVIIDFGLEKLTDQARRLLEKRAAIVDGSFDENNRAVVDWNALHAAIDRSFELADDEFAKTYFLAA